MKSFIKTFENENEKRLNLPLINRELETPLEDIVVDIFKSLETTGLIQYLGSEHITDESKIEYSNYITKRKKNNRAKNKNTRYMYIKPDRCSELILKFKFDVKGEVDYADLKLLLPKKDDNNYYQIKGNKYYLLYQLVDNSTYNTKDCLTLKSLMPVCITRLVDTIKDHAGEEYTHAFYQCKIFKRDIEPFLFFFSKYGFTKTLNKFNLLKIINVVNEANDTEKNRYFIINKNLRLEVNKHFFDNYSYVKSMVIMILRCFKKDIVKCFSKDVDLEDIHDINYWIRCLGSLHTKIDYKMHSTGKSTLVFFERLLDEGTKRTLKVNNQNKLNVYNVVKWMIQNFNELKKKNNMDLNNKRLRLNEYIGSILSKRVGDSINRILSLGNKVKLKQVMDIFKLQATIIFYLLYKSPLISYDDRVNDMTFWSALRYTMNKNVA